MGIIQKVKELNRARIQRRANRRREKARLDAAYRQYISECEELAPFAPKHPDAALYRHAWRRAEVLKEMSQGLDDPRLREFFNCYSKFADRAAKDYYARAPSNAYGTVRLEMSSKQAKAIWEKEVERLSPTTTTAIEKAGSIYLCICSQTNRRYVGQTIGVPESRWAQHRKAQTGPFKQGAIDPRYEILEIPVALDKLDARESFYIGYYDCYESGLNSTRGNNLRAYEQGRKQAEKDRRNVAS